MRRVDADLVEMEPAAALRGQREAGQLLSLVAHGVQVPSADRPAEYGFRHMVIQLFL